MKELSIEQKAKRYDEALEIAKEINNEQQSQPFNVMTRVFPELKESEGEKIRKELLNAFQESEDSLYMVLTPHKRESFIAWLKKQGEQKPDSGGFWEGYNSAKRKFEQNPAWSEEDERIYQSIMDDTVQENQLDDKQINWLKSLKERMKGE